MSKKHIWEFSTEELEEEVRRKRSKQQFTPKHNVIFFLGPPGSGKATQCKQLEKEFGFCHIATGEILRQHMMNSTRHGTRAKRYLTHGEPVPDFIVNELVKEEITSNSKCQSGIVFEGYPRNVEQAGYLDNILKQNDKQIDLCIEFETDDETNYERLEGRLIHPGSGRSYHVKFNPPRHEGRDDVTNEPLIRRNDDQRPISERKVKLYYENLDSLVHFYTRKNVLRSVNATKSINDIYLDIKSFLH